MDAKGFRDLCHVLLNVDLADLETAGVITPGAVGGSDWRRFNNEPLIFVLKLPDSRREALWKLLEERQPEHSWRSEAENAMKLSLEYLRGLDPQSTSGSHRNGDLRNRLKWVLLGCGGPLRDDRQPTTGAE